MCIRDREKLKHEKDVSVLDVAKALLDHGMHPPTMYFPLIVHEALMVEPTETESKESLEAAAESYLAVLAEANENPADMHNRPLTTYVRRLDEVTAARNPIAVSYTHLESAPVRRGHSTPLRSPHPPA